jgi:hypothetical protein
MRAYELEAREIVVECSEVHLAPLFGRVTLLALHTQPALVNVILAVAADAIARQADQQVRSVAALTGTG